MIEMKDDEIRAAMNDLGINRLPIQKYLLDQNAAIFNPFTNCMLAMEQSIVDVMTLHASWKSQKAANAALLEIDNGNI